MTNLDFDQLRSRSEFARLLGVSVDTLKAMERRGEAPPRIQVSPKVVAYRDSDIQKFLSARTIDAGPRLRSPPFLRQFGCH
jgi:predicted DNA-binding transcriptional regulator AlpA